MATCPYGLGHPWLGLKGHRWPGAWGRTHQWGSPNQGANVPNPKVGITPVGASCDVVRAPHPYSHLDLHQPTCQACVPITKHSMLSYHGWVAKAGSSFRTTSGHQAQKEKNGWWSTPPSLASLSHEDFRVFWMVGGLSQPEHTASPGLPTPSWLLWPEGLSCHQAGGNPSLWPEPLNHLLGSEAPGTYLSGEAWWNSGTGLDPPVVHNMIGGSLRDTMWCHPESSQVPCTSHREWWPVKCLCVRVHRGGGHNFPKPCRRGWVCGPRTRAPGRVANCSTGTWPSGRSFKTWRN